MRRLFAAVAALAIAAILVAPGASAEDGAMIHTGRVLISTGGDFTLPAAEQADAVVVVGGTATIAGEVNTIVVVDGRAILDGARTETIVAVRSPVDIGDGSVVLGDVRTVESLVTRHGDARVDGQVRSIAGEIAGFGFFLGPLFILLFAGFALASVVAGLLLAGLAARQVRAAEALISRQPGTTFLVGIAGIFVPILVVVALFVTVIGAPLGLGILFGLWPLVAFLGWLVSGIWIGDWILRRSSSEPVRERPYLAAVLGIVILQLLAIWPFLPMIASLFGTGAVIRLAWQTFRSSPTAAPVIRVSAPAPMRG